MATDHTCRMGQLERKLPTAADHELSLDNEPASLMLTFVAVGHILVHAMRGSAPETRYTHLQGQVPEYGQVGQRASRGKDAFQPIL